MTSKDWASHFWITLVDEEGERELSTNDNVPVNSLS
jgi:hypothetical protein